MRKLRVLALFIACAIGARSAGQIAAAAAGSPAPARKAEKPANDQAKNTDKKKEDKSTGTNLFGSSALQRQSINRRQRNLFGRGFFDSTKNMASLPAV
jgi:hypothetical protein